MGNKRNVYDREGRIDGGASRTAVIKARYDFVQKCLPRYYKY